MIPALEFKWLESGVDFNKPLVLFISLIAEAAKQLLYDDTIHDSLRMTVFSKSWKTNGIWS